MPRRKKEKLICFKYSECVMHMNLTVGKTWYTCFQDEREIRIIDEACPLFTPAEGKPIEAIEE